MHSLYEIETTVKRVTKHQGLSWGIAEEAGKIVRILEQSELPGLESFNRLINTPYSECTKTIDLQINNQKQLCPIHFGLFFLDQSHHFKNQNQFHSDFPIILKFYSHESHQVLCLIQLLNLSY